MTALVYDYRDATRRWGHDIAYEPAPGNRLNAHGWGEPMREGDYILLTRPEGGETRYFIESIRWADDPRDQWFATLVFAPRPVLAGGDPW